MFSPKSPGGCAVWPDDLAYILRKERRAQLCERLQCYGIDTLGKLEAALRGGELLHMDPDTTDFLNDLVKSETISASKLRTVADPVHGNIRFSRKIWHAVIDTKPFQRLRCLKQLGAVCYVFPAATHTRFEHSLGVGHLAGVWNKTLRQPFSSAGSFANERLNYTVQIGGLCHDLGHGPFSHAFEGFMKHYMMQQSLDTDWPVWRHEDMSIDLVNYLINESGSALGCLIDEVDIKPQDIRDVITGRDPRSMLDMSMTPPGSARSLFDHEDALQEAMFSIVCNRKDGLDVDRFDYLSRDARIGVGLPTINSHRLMTNSAVNSQGEIVFDVKCQAEIFNIYRTRFDMFNNVYLHKNSLAVECMLQDILTIMNPVYGLAEATGDPELYIQFNDTVVMDWFNCAKRVNPGVSGTPAFAEAQRVIERLEKRDLYAYIGQVTQTTSERRPITEELLYTHCDSRLVRRSDIIVKICRTSYGAPQGSPWHSVKLYHGNPDDSRHVTAPDHYPSQWERQVTMVFCRSNNPLTWDALSQGVSSACAQRPTLAYSPHKHTDHREILPDRYTFTPPSKLGLRRGL